MSDVTNNQQNGAVDDYFGSGKNYTLKSGVNKDVKVKSWSIESNEREGKKSFYLKITYVHPQQGVDHDDSTKIKKKINFQGIRLKGLFQLEGTLVCGYGAPKQSGDEIKQYLTPAKYGQGGCYKSAFRTNNDEELPSEKTDGFKDDNDKKYNYWSYTRTKKESTQVAQESAPAVDTGGW